MGVYDIRMALPPAHGAEPKQRLICAAHEFEGQLLKELLKPLTTAGGWSSGDCADDSTGILGEFAAETLGKGLSEQGGFGIAKRIVDQFSRSGNHPGTDAVTGDGHFNTGQERSNH